MEGMGGDDGTAALFGANVPGMPDKVPKAPEHDEDNPMGGMRFRQMMDQAQQRDNQAPSRIMSSTPPQPQAIPPPSGAMPPQQAVPAAAPQAVAPPEVFSPDQMAIQMQIYQQQIQVWQQQMNTYAEFTATNPEAAAQMNLTMPPPPTPPAFTNSTPGAAAAVPATPVAYNSPPQSVPAPTLPPTSQDPDTMSPRDYLPKGSGNKDAYEITNPADVYLAQLKRDSTVRTEARKRGDLETANNPFADVGVKAIGNILSDELLASRRKQIAENGGEFETSRDEMIIPYADVEDTTQSDYTGISYKQKLMEMKKKRQGQQ